MGVPHAGQKRSRPGDAAQKRRDDFQLDFLAALRVIENLGTDSPTVHDNIRSLRDPPLLSVLNFISLIVETDSTRLNRSDIAVAVSADPGQLQLLLVKANGQTPTDGECTNLASFVQTLRDSLRDDHRNEVLITKRFMNLISQRHYPELSRKLSRIGTLGGKTPKQNWARFTSLLPLWQRAYPMGERSHGFVKLAQEIHGAVHEEYAAENLMIDEIRRFILHDHAQPQAMDDMSPKARYYLTEFALESSMRLIHSNFFRDVIRQGRFRNMLNEDEEDHIFLFEMFRRINDVARYLQGLRHFVQEGITYIVKALGPEGLERFLSCTGGIIPRWVVHRRRYRPRTLFWGTHPEDKVRRLLTSGHVATYTHDASERPSNASAPPRDRAHTAPRECAPHDPGWVDRHEPAAVLAMLRVHAAAASVRKFTLADVADDGAPPRAVDDTASVPSITTRLDDV
ncbi:hypothetical protein H0H92_008091 [Tricholoma furcatifolium]|nr:hypothetical protein H0H92_008091 [Tricholoma furcatifolium]